MNIQESLNLIISISTLGGLVFVIYKTFRDPDVKAERDIKELNVQCNLKHQRIDEINRETKEDIKEIRSDLKYMKENHLTHIERDINMVVGEQKEIKGQLKFLNDNLTNFLKNAK